MKLWEKDPFLQPVEHTVFLSGLDREITLLQISDLHLSTVDETSTEAYRQHAGELERKWDDLRIHFAREAGDRYDAPHLLPREEAFDRLLRFAGELKPDAMLLTGDMMEEYSPENLCFLEKRLNQVPFPWLWVPGNHEAGYEKELASLRQGRADVQTLSIGNCRLIGLDDSGKKVDRKQREEVLKAARDCVPVLVMHIPALTEHNREAAEVFDPYYLMGSRETDGDTEAFLSVLTAENGPFELVLCGHVHAGHLSELRPGCLQLCASSAMIGACTILHLKKGPGVSLEKEKSPGRSPAGLQGF